MVSQLSAHDLFVHVYQPGHLVLDGGQLPAELLDLVGVSDGQSGRGIDCTLLSVSVYRRICHPNSTISITPSARSSNCLLLRWCAAERCPNVITAISCVMIPVFTARSRSSAA